MVVMVDGLPAAVDPGDAVQAAVAAHEDHGVPGAGTDRVRVLRLDSRFRAVAPPVGLGPHRGAVRDRGTDQRVEVTGFDQPEPEQVSVEWPTPNGIGNLRKHGAPGANRARRGNL